MSRVLVILARCCARAALGEGWASPGAEYALLPGDEEVLREALGRAPTRAEAVEFEARIQAALDELRA